MAAKKAGPLIAQILDSLGSEKTYSTAEAAAAGPRRAAPGRPSASWGAPSVSHPSPPPPAPLDYAQ